MNRMSVLLTIELLAVRIHKSVNSIRSDVARNPRSLPPICRLPGTKRLLWREIDVEQWVAQFVEKEPARKVALVAEGAGSKRGRPTKRQQLEAKQRSC